MNYRASGIRREFERSNYPNKIPTNVPMEAGFNAEPKNRKRQRGIRLDAALGSVWYE